MYRLHNVDAPKSSSPARSTAKRTSASCTSTSTKLATRYDKLDVTFLGFVHSANTMKWLRTCPVYTDDLKVLDLLGIFNQIDLTVAVN